MSLVVTFTTQLRAEGCDKLCDRDWWESATETAINKEIDAFVDPNVRDKYGRTPLYYAIFATKPLRFQVQFEDSYAERIMPLWPVLRDILRYEKSSIGPIRLQASQKDELRIKIGKLDGMPLAVALANSQSSSITSFSGEVSHDLAVSFQNDILIVSLTDHAKKIVRENMIEQTVSVTRRRVDEMLTGSSSLQRRFFSQILVKLAKNIQVVEVDNNEQLVVDAPDEQYIEDFKLFIETPAVLTFQTVVGQTGNANAKAGFGNELLQDADNSELFYILERTPFVTGEELTDAKLTFDQNGRPAVNIWFNTSGARKLGQYTTDHIGEPFAIVLDSKVISAPTIQSAITGGSALITGNIDGAESGKLAMLENMKLAMLLRAGSLPAKLKFIVSPETNWLEKLITAGVSLEVKDNRNGITALHNAAFFGSASHVTTLLNAGADVKANDKFGRTPWELAKSNAVLRGTKAYDRLKLAN